MNKIKYELKKVLEFKDEFDNLHSIFHLYVNDVHYKFNELSWLIFKHSKNIFSSIEECEEFLFNYFFNFKEFKYTEFKIGGFIITKKNINYLVKIFDQLFKMFKLIE